MRKIFSRIILIMLCAIITNCSQNEFIESEVDGLKLSKDKITQFQQNLMVTLKANNANDFNNVLVNESEILKIEDNYYLRSHYNNGYVSTTSLTVKLDNTLDFLGITCTTKACAENGGCVPSGGKKCTMCTGDCLKVTTGLDEG